MIRFFGTSAAVPSLQRGFASIGLVSRSTTSEEDILLLDCGDGSIRKIMETYTNCTSISNVLITHFHSDHLSGLAQLVESMSIERRSEALNVYGPRGLKDYYDLVQSKMNIASKRRFEVNIHELNSGEMIRIGNDYSVLPLAMAHTIPCIGYRINSGEFVVSYTGDTEPCPELGTLAKKVNILIHEATFLQKDVANARDSKHSTPGEAARIASESDVGRLVLTHVNDRHETPREMLEEASEFFSNTQVAYDGMELEI